MVDTTEEAVLLALASAFALVLVLVVTCHIGDDVQWPAQELLAHHVHKSRNRCFFGHLMELMSELSNSAGIFFSCLRDENHVSFHIAGGLVMFTVRNLP